MKWMERVRSWLAGGTSNGEREQQSASQNEAVSESDAALMTPPLPTTDPSSESEAQGEPDAEPTSTEAEGIEESAASGAFRVGWITDTGMVRDHNEDGLFVFVSEQESAESVPPFGLFVLADGMGGHKSGELASAMASRTVAAHLLSQVYLSLLQGEERVSTQPSLTEVLAEAITAANRAVNLSLPGSGTTLTCGMILGSRLFIGHVGDSRAYLRSAEGEIRLLTNDHSMVNKLVEIGQLTKEEAAVHPQRNMLYRAVGQGAALDVDVVSYSLHSYDQIFLCSDGLWGLLSDEEIWDVILSAPDPTQACARLTEAANAAGGNDNITAILVEVRRMLA
jgi:serine/threonine protein phosphatase PrpC